MIKNIEISIFFITQSLDVILNDKQIFYLDWGPRAKSCPGAPHNLKTALPVIMRLRPKKHSSFHSDFKISKLTSLLLLFLYFTFRPTSPTANRFDLDNPQQLSTNISRYSLLTSKNYHFNSKSKFSISLTKNSHPNLQTFQILPTFQSYSSFLAI